MHNQSKRYLVGVAITSSATAAVVTIQDIRQQIDNLGLQSASLDPDTGQPRTEAKVVEEIPTPGLNQSPLLVAELTAEKVAELRKSFGDAIVLEEDESIDPMDASFYRRLVENGSLADVRRALVVTLRGPKGEPVANARVDAQGGFFFAREFTGADGNVTITVVGNQALEVLSIKPAHTYWSIVVEQPEASGTGAISIGLTKIADGLDPANPSGGQQIKRWGTSVMGLDNLSPSNVNVRIAIIDSGLNAKHPDLVANAGIAIDADRADSWVDDQSSHGTHVAGVCGAQDNLFGIVGMAPGAAILGVRIFPNASNSKLIKALNWCVSQQVDVINMSLGSSGESLLVRQAIQQCVAAGILPIAAAGNSGGAVLFPAAYPEVVAVAAIGKLNSYPTNSSHARTETSLRSGDYFAATFSCHGPEVDVCAPGVAVTSCVQSIGYAAWDGTSMACPHVTGFVARMLQHTPELLSLPRDGQRTQAIRQALLARCTELEGIPKKYQGSGLPSFGPAITGTSDIRIDKIVELLTAALQVAQT